MTSECCTPAGAPDRANPPGLDALRYRIGTWSSFRQAMVARLSTQVTAPDVDPAGAGRPLANLTTRADSDETIALIDAWACACDVLTFYGERILNEGYLTTAVETRSVTHIASSIGYRPDPGVAASVALALTIDSSASSPVSVPAGQAVLSVPAQGELSQTFEVTEELEARVEWNILRPRTTQAHAIEQDTLVLYLEGVNTRLVVGDPIVVLGRQRTDHPGTGDVTERWDLRFVVAAETDAARGFTLVTLDRGLGDGYTHPADTDVTVLTFRSRGGLFGWNAPDARVVSEDIRNNTDLVVNGQWRDFQMASDRSRRDLGSNVVELDLEYPAIVVGSWVCLHSPIEVELYRVDRVNPAARTDFSLTGRVTRLFLDSDEQLDRFGRRSTTVLLASEELDVAERPDDDPVSGYTVRLDDLVPAMPVGRTVLVTGLDTAGEPVVIETTVDAWEDGDKRSAITFATELPPLARDSVAILGNVAAATHGATVADEVLGNGDASASHQRFALRHSPLTWVPAVPEGSAPDLDLRVGGVLWERIDSLYDAGPQDRVYTVERDSEDRSVVAFGDGRRGARPPTGTENVRAQYRKGIGLDGEVGSGQLTLLHARPPGLRAVTNPASAVGAADPATFDDIRRDAPRDVLTLGRLVSLHDYEDFAAAFPGIGKARAMELWDGRRGFVHLTVASASGGVLAPSDATVTTLVASIEAVQDPGHRALVSGHEAVGFGVALDVVVDDAYVAGDVVAAVEAALVGTFAFERRGFAQAVFSAEVLRVVHTVPGVVAADLEHLYRVGDTPAHNATLVAASPSWDGVAVTKAELLLADEAFLDVGVMEDT